jgi:hypothetical protein
MVSGDDPGSRKSQVQRSPAAQSTAQVQQGTLLNERNSSSIEEVFSKTIAIP